MLSVNLGLAVDFRALTVSGTLTFDLPVLAQSLILSCGNGTPAFTVSLAGDGGAVAAFPPLTLYPSAMLPAVDAVAERVALALLAQGAAQLLTHPITWVLSPNVLGDGGGDLDLAKLGTLLGGLTDTAISGPGGLSVRCVADGLALSGLPFGMTATLTSAISGLTLGVGASPTLGAGLTVAISGDIGYAPTTGFALATKMTLEETLSSLGVFSISTSYDTASGVGLTLSVPTSAGTSPVAVTLVPYPSLSALAADFGQAVEQGLLRTISVKFDLDGQPVKMIDPFHRFLSLFSSVVGRSEAGGQQGQQANHQRGEADQHRQIGHVHLGVVQRLAGVRPVLRLLVATDMGGQQQNPVGGRHQRRHGQQVQFG